VKVSVCAVECCGIWFRILVSSIAGINQISFQLLVCEWLQGDASIALESPDQKTRGFVFQIALPR
jgi:hypothetical protein